MALTERKEIINPYQVERRNVAGTLSFNLFTPQNRLLLNNRFILRFDRNDDSISFLITKEDRSTLTSESEFASSGLNRAKNITPGWVNSHSIPVSDPEKFFLNNGEYEIRYLGAENNLARILIFSNHEFIFEWIRIKKNDISYLKKILSSPTIPGFKKPGKSRIINHPLVGA